MQYDLVIIGSGLAAYTVAKEWRKLNPEASLCMVTRSAGDYYSKPMLSNVMKQNKMPQDLSMATADEMARKLDATMVTDSVVSKLDVKNHELFIDETAIKYDKCVLALGASTIRPPFVGSAVDDVFHVNELEDYELFYNAVCDAQSVTIIGSGLVGSEFANDILSLGKKVNILSMDSYPLAQLVVPEIGFEIDQAFGQAGIHCLWNAKVESIDRKDGLISVGYQCEGELRHVTSDVVLSAVGIKANTQLALGAGIVCDAGGICTNDLGQTSAPDIFALGDCANINGFKDCYVAPILLAAKAIAKNLVGDITQINFPIMPIVVKTPLYPIACVPLYRSDVEGKWQVEVLDKGMCAKFMSHDEHVLAFVLASGAVGMRRELLQQMDVNRVYGGDGEL